MLFFEFLSLGFSSLVAVEVVAMVSSISGSSLLSNMTSVANAD